MSKQNKPKLNEIKEITQTNLRPLSGEVKVRLKVGDVVYSKKHNTYVCVHEIKDENIIYDWFDKEQNLHRKTIPDEFILYRKTSS